MCMCSYAASQVLASSDPNKMVVKSFQYVPGVGVQVTDVFPAPSEAAGRNQVSTSILSLANKRHVK